MFNYIIGFVATGLLCYLGYNNLSKEINIVEKREVIKKELNGSEVKSALIKHTKLPVDMINIISNMINFYYIINKLPIDVYHKLIKKPNKHFKMKFEIESKNNIKYVE